MEEKFAGLSANDALSSERRATGRARRSLDHNRQSNDEIAELEAELRQAYVRKELEAQVASRQAERFVESVREREAAERSRLEEQLAMEWARRRSSEVARRKCEEYSRQLEEQTTLKEKRKRAVMEEARRERKFLEEVDRITEERERNTMLENRNQLVETTRRERLISQEIKQIREREEKERDEKERTDAVEYLMDVERREKEMKRLRDEHAESRERVLLELAASIVDVETKKRKREVLLLDLMAQELKCELLVREEEERRRRGKMRAELASTLEEQIAFAERCKLRFVEQDREFAGELMEKIMEDQRTAALTVIARKRLQLKYREDLEQLMRERRRIREEEIARVEEAVKEERRVEELRKESVREERKRLVAAHASNVADFLKKDALTDEECRLIASLKIEDREIDADIETSSRYRKEEK